VKICDRPLLSHKTFLPTMQEGKLNWVRIWLQPPSAPAEKAPPQGSDPYADFAALLDYQDKNDGLLPPPRNTRPAPPSPVGPRPVEAVKPRVISRAGSRLSALSDIKVPTPRPVRKAGWGGNEAPSYKGNEEPNYKGYEDSSYKSGMPSGGVTEYKLGDSSAVQVSSQLDFPVRLKQHKVPKKGGGAKKTEEASESVPVQIENRAPETEVEQRGALGLAALQAGGLGSAKPPGVKREEPEKSFLPGRGREYTVGEVDSDVSVVSASSFPVRTKSHREPKGGYSMGADVGGKVKVPPKKVRKRVPTYQELVSGAAKIVDTSLPVPAGQVQAAAKFDKVSGKEELTPPDDVRPSDDISGPRVYSLGEDEGAFSVEPAENIPVRLKALKAEKTAGSADNSKEKPGKVAQKVPGFKLPAEVRESGALKKNKPKAGKEKDVGFRPVTAKAPDLSGGLFAAAKQFLTSRGLGSGDAGAEAIAQTKQLRETLGERVTSAQAVVIDEVLSLIEAKMLAEAQGALIVPVMEGKVKLKGKKERAQVVARFPKWKEGYEKVCIDADYALRQLDGLAVELGRSERSEEDQRSRRKERGGGPVGGVRKEVSAASTANLAEKEETMKAAESKPSAVQSSAVEKEKMQSRRTEAEQPAELKEALPEPAVVSPSRKEPRPSSSRTLVEGGASVRSGENAAEVGSSSGSPAKETRARGEVAAKSDGTSLEAASSADLEMDDGEADDEPPNWEDDPEVSFHHPRLTLN
jgi:hypothetical protein